MLVLMLIVAGTTAESLDQERKKGTWLVLISTPLTAAEILGAKRRRSIRAVAPFVATLLAAWGASLVVGALHPLGFLAGLAGVSAALRFAGALGAYSAVRAAESQPGGHLALVVLCLGLFLTPIPTYVTGRAPWLTLAAASPPFEALVCLMTWDEVHAAIGRAAFGGIPTLKVEAGGSGALWVVATAILTPVVLVVATRWLDREVDRLWDAAVGRPRRANGRDARDRGRLA
jgi:hypothetical protein